jgi:hypothetical protein
MGMLEKSIGKFSLATGSDFLSGRRLKRNNGSTVTIITMKISKNRLKW